MQGILRALKVPSFGRLAGTYALNEVADWFASIALAVLVYGATEDALATTALFVANRFIPAFVVPALAAKSDAFPTARLLAGIYAVEAVVLTGLALSTTEFLLPVVLLLAFVDGTLAATGRAVTRSATVALMEPKGLLREGNAVLNLSFSAMNAGAPAIAGVLVAATSESTVLAVAAALFLMQAVTISGASQLSRGEVEPAPWRDGLREGVAYVRGHRFLRTLLGSQTLVILLLMMIVPVEIIYANESLNAGDAGYGALLATWGVGMVVGGLVFARERRRPIMVLVVSGTVLQALAYLGLAAAPTLTIACAVTVIGGIGNGVHWVSVVTAVQEATAERFQARIAGLLESLVTAVPGVGFLLGGAITSLTDPRVALTIAGSGVLLVMLVTLLARTPARTMASAAPDVAEAAPEPAG